MLFNETFDNWIRELFLWTFEHELVSAWFIAIPISLWVILGLFAILIWGSTDDDDKSWVKPLLVVGGYVLVPIAYWFLAGYVGNLIYG